MKLKVDSFLSAKQISSIIKVIPSAIPMRISFERQTVKVVPSGIPQVDSILGVGGFPYGRISEIFGKESCGKTTLSLQVAKQVTDKKGLVFYIDGEHALDLGYLEALKLNQEFFILDQPSCLEEAYSNMEKFIKEARALSKDIPLMVIYDSVASIPPKAELEGDLETERPGLMARKISQGLRKLVSVISKNDVCVIFINQLRERLNVRFGSPETTPGGKALKFYATIRLDMRQVANKSSDKSIESQVRVKNVKNKIARPFRQADIFLKHGHGFDTIKSLWQQAIDEGLIKPVGTRSFSYKDKNISFKLLQQEEDLQQELLTSLAI